MARTDGLTNSEKESIDMINALGDGKKLGIVSGVIRNTGSGWDLISDSSHGNTYVDSVTNDTSKITIDYTSMGATKILSFVIVPDETYSELGYSMGSSVGKTFAEVYVSKVAGNSAAALFQFDTPDTVSVPFNQEKGILTHTYDSTSKFFTVTHQDYGSSLPWIYPPVISPRRTCPSNRKIESVTGTETKFFFEDNSGTKIEPPTGSQFTFSRGEDFIVEDVDPNDLTESVGNFWFIGIFEIA